MEPTATHASGQGFRQEPLPPIASAGAVLAPRTLTPLSFAAGCISGAMGTAIGFPLDSVKVRLQARDTAPITLRSLFNGMFGPVATAGMIQSANLGLYENFRRWLRQRYGVVPGEATPLPIVGVAAAQAGACISPVTTPTARVKIVQQLTGERFLPATLALWREGSLFRGFSSNFIFELCRGIYMILYVGIKRELELSCQRTQIHAALAADAANPRGTSEGIVGSDPPPRAVPTDGEALTLGYRVAAGASANVLTWALVYPIDVIKTVQQSSPPGSVAPVLGVWTTMRALVKEGGVPRLYRGFGYTLLRAGPVAGILLPLFDLSLAALEKFTPTLRN